MVLRMKKEIHPAYYTDATVTCACGAKYQIAGTMKEIRVEICGACHPFYTGNEKILDTAGRVDKFKKRTEASKKVASKSKK